MSLVLEFFEHTLGDKDASARKSKSVEHVVIESDEFILEIGWPVTDAGNILPDFVDIVLQREILNPPAHLFFNFWSVAFA